jgi:hypothetical protein
VLHAQITEEDLSRAHEAFEENESRDLFYRAAIELVDLSFRGSTSLSLAEAFSVPLKTWNSAFYRFKRFDAAHYSEIEDLLAEHKPFV